MPNRLTPRRASWPLDGIPEMSLVLLADRNAWVLSTVRSAGDLLTELPLVEFVLPRLEVGWLLAVLQDWGAATAVEGVVKVFLAEHPDVFNGYGGVN